MSEVDLEEFNTALSVFADRVPDSVEYQRLCEISLRHPFTHRLRELDPFSEAYTATVLQLYHDLRGDDRNYDPLRDEQSGLSLPQNLWSGASPWSFRDSTFVAEFLLSWGQIMRSLALPPGKRCENPGIRQRQRPTPVVPGSPRVANERRRHRRRIARAGAGAGCIDATRCPY